MAQSGNLAFQGEIIIKRDDLFQMGLNNATRMMAEQTITWFYKSHRVQHGVYTKGIILKNSEEDVTKLSKANTASTIGWTPCKFPEHRLTKRKKE